jgi:hypothetical protein
VRINRLPCRHGGRRRPNCYKRPECPGS